MGFGGFGITFQRLLDQFARFRELPLLLLERAKQMQRVVLHRNRIEDRAVDFFRPLEIARRMQLHRLPDGLLQLLRRVLRIGKLGHAKDGLWNVGFHKTKMPP
jgi:hypothetical protein